MPSEWTIDTLKEHIDAILSERNKALEAALAAAKEAVAKAEENSEKWRSNANEWRGAMTDRESRFVGREEYDGWKKSIEQQLGTEMRRGLLGEGRGLGLHAGWGYLIGLIGIIAALVTLFSRR